MGLTDKRRAKENNDLFHCFRYEGHINREY